MRRAQTAEDSVVASHANTSPPRDEPVGRTDGVTLDLPRATLMNDTIRGRARLRIRKLVRIAASNGSSLLTDELYALFTRDWFPSRETLEAFLVGDEILSQELVFIRGEVTPRGKEQLIDSREKRRALTAERIHHAKEFAARLTEVCPGIELFAVSGSTAYGSAKPDDDLDIFFVTSPNRLWIALLSAMILAKLGRLGNHSAPTLCFNRVTERDECIRSFRDANEPLFAREALSLKVLRGEPFFHKLLLQSPWMARFFPDLYRIARDRERGKEEPHGRPGFLTWTLANTIAFILLGAYLQAVGLVRNGRLSRQGRDSARFRTVVERRFCAYESKKYDDLRAEYLRGI